MPLMRLVENPGFSPEDIKVLEFAWKAALAELGPSRDDPRAEDVAGAVIRFALEGERDPTRLRALAVKAVR